MHFRYNEISPESFSADGRTTGRLLSPSQNHEKEYEVKVDKLLSERFVRKMETGIVLGDGQKTKPAIFKKKGDSFFSIILTEGKKRQIRRMCSILGYKVLDLKRTRVMNVLLGNLEAGKFRQLEGKELKSFLSGLGLK